MMPLWLCCHCCLNAFQLTFVGVFVCMYFIFCLYIIYCRLAPILDSQCHFRNECMRLRLNDIEQWNSKNKNRRREQKRRRRRMEWNTNQNVNPHLAAHLAKLQSISMSVSSDLQNWIFIDVCVCAFYSFLQSPKQDEKKFALNHQTVVAS